jgi:phage terminase large subunit-like protein
MLQFGLRLGDRPQQVITTTPRPIGVLREILASKGTVVTRGNTTENVSNLPPSFVQQIVSRYAGTRLGRQELNAEILDDNPNALWKRDQIDKLKVKESAELMRVVVALDPSGTHGENQSEDAADVGIIVAGRGVDGKCYVLADRTCNLSPAGWGKRAVAAYNEFEGDLIVAERNFGGAMVKHVIRTAAPMVPYKEVTASRGKWVRAEPVAALYEQERVKHVGAFPELEDEMCSFGPDGLADERSPNRVDALVWAITELMLAPVHMGAIQGHYGRSKR